MRNTNSYFSHLPNINIRRSKFPRPHDHKMTMNSGVLVPIFVDECLAGDTHTLDTSVICRMSTPLHPVMDNAFLDYYFFFVPNRLVWDNWKEFMGENNKGPWITGSIPHTVPKGLNVPYFYQGSVRDYMGIPYNADKYSLLPTRAYALIWNEFFRGENAFQPCVVDKGDFEAYINEGLSENEALQYNYIQTAHLGGALCPVAKFHDYFTSALPSPQKGPDVYLPLGDVAPVRTYEDILNTYTESNNPLMFSFQSNVGASEVFNITANPGSSSAASKKLVTAHAADATMSDAGSDNFTVANLGADLSEATSLTVNTLREVLALQRFYEIDARGGTRYTEMLQAHFGVSNPDARLQRPEYIGGKRVQINMQQVLQTGATVEGVSPQGNTAAYSLTGDVSNTFTFSCSEHGWLIGVCCIRTSQTYQYGLEKMWSRTDRTDFYFPTFAHIGEQAILNKEIYAGTDADNEVFGYQEAWAEYRYKPSRVSGQFRSDAEGTLDSWHYAEILDDLPTLSPEFLAQSKNVIDRTLAVRSELADQFILDWYFKLDSVRPMPVHSIPGLSNHF